MLLTIGGALIVGLTLGMLGSGGSAITVPLLIYMLGHETKQAIAESMAIVGLISVAAVIPYMKHRQIDWRCVWGFGLPGMLGTLCGAWLGGVSPDLLQLVVFAIVLLAAAYSMLKSSRHETSDEISSEASNPAVSRTRIAWLGLAVGCLTGFVGVGGGFIIVPALAILTKLPMRMAIGTSLVIIILNAVVGFAKYQHHLAGDDMMIDSSTILIFAGVGGLGSVLGRLVNNQLSPQALRQVFATFLLLLGSFVIVHEGSKLWAATPIPSPGSVVSYSVSRSISHTNSLDSVQRLH